MCAVVCTVTIACWLQSAFNSCERVESGTVVEFFLSLVLPQILFSHIDESQFCVE